MRPGACWERQFHFRFLRHAPGSVDKKKTPVVYGSDAINDVVYEYDQSGGASILTITGLSDPQGIATDNVGNL